MVEGICPNCKRGNTLRYGYLRAFPSVQVVTCINCGYRMEGNKVVNMGNPKWRRLM